jgi:hypothetical protein
MMAFIIRSDYAWFASNRSMLPEGVAVLHTEESRSALRPWTLVSAPVTGFVALGPRLRHPERREEYLARLFLFQRWRPVRERLQIVDCAAGRLANVADEAALDPATPASDYDWQALAPDDPLLAAVCRDEPPAPGAPQRPEADGGRSPGAGRHAA